MSPELAEIGQALREEWIARAKQGSESLARSQARTERTAPMLAAVIATRRGDHGAIQRLLRSDHALSADDRETLAHYLDGGFDTPSARGTPKSNTRWLTMHAENFFAEWRSAAKAANVSTYGCSEAMKETAVDFILAQFVPRGVHINREAALENFKRPKDRRN